MTTRRIYANQPSRPNRGEGRWPEQFKRVKRLFERVRAISQGKDSEEARAFLREHGSASWWSWGTHSDLGQHFRDDIYSFFVHCYHLKDWIQADPELMPALRVEDFINSSKGLVLCADIANGVKHLLLAPRAGGAEARIGPATTTQGPTTYSVGVTVVTATGSVNAFDVARQCVKEWEEYIEGYLLPPLAALDKREADRVFGHFERNRQGATPFPSPNP